MSACVCVCFGMGVEVYRTGCWEATQKDARDQTSQVSLARRRRSSSQARFTKVMERGVIKRRPVQADRPVKEMRRGGTDCACLIPAS